jgi:hypothetical protein
MLGSNIKAALKTYKARKHPQIRHAGEPQILSRGDLAAQSVASGLAHLAELGALTISANLSIGFRR